LMLTAQATGTECHFDQDKSVRRDAKLARRILRLQRS
jgi:hypothetical protein